MSILTHHIEQRFQAVEPRPLLTAARKNLARRIALHILTLLSTGSVLVALIALKTAIHVWHLPA